MDFLNLSLTSTTIATISLFLLFSYYLFSLLKPTNKNNQTPPEAPGAWPIIGHLHLLSGPELPHKTLGSMADKYGPIFTINIGVHKTLVVSDSKIAKECFTTNDKALAGRPKSLAVETMCYNYAMFGLGPYGPYWRKIRKIVMSELLSNTRLESLQHVRVNGIKTFVKEIYRKKNISVVSGTESTFEMKEYFGNLTLRMIIGVLFGEWYTKDEDEHIGAQKAMRKFLEILGTFVVSDAVPLLRWLDIGGSEKEMKKVAMELDTILEKWLGEHKRKRNDGQMKGEDQDFMAVMLSILEGDSPEDLAGFDADTVSKATCLAMLAAATETTTVTLTWAISLLLNNRHVLKRAQDELDIHVGRERQVEDSDIKNLVYLQAIIKETFRLYPPLPLSAPHESIENCTVGGYLVSEGTRLVTNIWKIHRDPCVWPDPLDFRPERFLTSHKDVEVWGNHFELMPFGSGRRVCPGISLSLQVAHLTLATLIQGFEISTPLDEPVDMSESFGLSNLKASPLEVLLTPRLPRNVYEVGSV